MELSGTVGAYMNTHGKFEVHLRYICDILAIYGTWIRHTRNYRGPYNICLAFAGDITELCVYACAILLLGNLWEVRGLIWEPD